MNDALKSLLDEIGTEVEGMANLAKSLDPDRPRTPEESGLIVLLANLLHQMRTGPAREVQALELRHGADAVLWEDER